MAPLVFKLAHLLIKFPPGRWRGSKNFAYPIENTAKEKVRLFVNGFLEGRDRGLVHAQILRTERGFSPLIYKNLQ
jgi:hypothetical protein